MKTNRPLLVCLMFVSVWLSSEPARGQTSTNIVGYVRVVFTNGYYFIANPLIASPDNTLTNIIPSMPNGSRAYVWDVTNQVFLPRATYVGEWDLNYDLPPGKGFVIFAPSRCTNTFVGNVLLGTVTNFVAGTNKFSLLGSKIPQTGQITSELGFPGTDGDHVYLFRSASQSFSDAYTYHGGYGWFDPQGIEGTGGPTNLVAESFFVQNPGPNTNWVRTFTLSGAPTSSLTTTANSKERKISQIKINSGKVTLKLRDPGGGRYDVRFSTDGMTWTTVAKNQFGGTWTGKLPDAMSGYCQIVTSPTEGSAP